MAPRQFRSSALAHQYTIRHDKKRNTATNAADFENFIKMNEFVIVKNTGEDFKIIPPPS